jgi:hypothetical protein
MPRKHPDAFTRSVKTNSAICPTSPFLKRWPETRLPARESYGTMGADSRDDLWSGVDDF